MKEYRMKFFLSLLLICSLFLSILSGCDLSDIDTGYQNTLEETDQTQVYDSASVTGDTEDTDISDAAERMELWTDVSYEDPDRADSVEDVPEYEGQIYVVINENQPGFTEEELNNTESYESYSNLDDLGRCGVAEACIGQDIMPTEKRGAIGQVKPTGWHTVKYDSVDGLYLYNRCHLIAYELAAENANEKNLITGTRYMNVEGMLPFENMVTDFVKETDFHVLYRVTPVFEGENLVASGVQMEARSIEDDGEGICFHVYVYNVQPYVAIDYATGDSWETDEAYEIADTVDSEPESTSADTSPSESSYVLNTNTGKFHDPDCSSVAEIKESNREEFTGSRDEVISMGYEPCGRCHP